MVRLSCQTFALSLPLAILATPLPQQQNGPPPPPPLPSCAAPALAQAILSSGCAPNNAPCLCANPRLIPGLQAALRTTCTESADIELVREFPRQFCGRENLASFASEFGTTAAVTSSGEATTDYSTVVPPEPTGMPTFWTGSAESTTEETTNYSTVVPPEPTGMPTFWTGSAGSTTMAMTGNATVTTAMTTMVGGNGTMATSVPEEPVTRNGTADSGAGELARSLGALVIGMGAVVLGAEL
ncbi:hypothetical protein MBLNU230_g4172t1 [Neophaeotheca triangularis]